MSPRLHVLRNAHHTHPSEPQRYVAHPHTTTPVRLCALALISDAAATAAVTSAAGTVSHEVHASGQQGFWLVSVVRYRVCEVAIAGEQNCLSSLRF